MSALPPLADPDPAAWIGRTEEAEDTLSSHLVAMLAATLDIDAKERDRRRIEDGAPVPALWHWTAYPPLDPMSALGPDGHPRRGGFLPPIDLERRMWAGARIAFHDAILIGERVLRRSEILAVAEKTGAAGRMVLVTVGHRISTRRGLALEEEHDIAYVARPARYRPPTPLAAPADPAWEEEVPIDPVRLFRFSAATFNAHRIHYDLAYTTDVEGYPGLVVHGPLQAVLLMEAARRRRGGEAPAGFRFRGTRPLFHFDRLRLLGLPPEAGEQRLFAATGEGHVTMQATVAWPS